jgi:hypothetical protein
MNNDLSTAEKIVEFGPGAAKEMVVASGNVGSSG